MRQIVPLVSAAALAVGLVGRPADAQVRDGLAGAVVDVRVVSTTLPTGPGWTPPVTTSAALVPNRGVGVDGGVHLFVGPGRFRRLSVGTAGLVAEGRATGEGAATVATRLIAVAPQVSVNFGHRDGWSYLSGGAGAARVQSTEGGVTDDPATWGLVMHYGGGARWFLREHLAVSLDLRFWALTPRAATAVRVSGAATTRVAFSAGLAFR